MVAAMSAQRDDHRKFFHLCLSLARYYPAYKLGHVITAFEVKPDNYGTHLVDFHITQDLLISKDERIRLLVAQESKIETSSCIISPQQVNILLNGKPVDKRTNVLMDPGPQVPTIVNHLLECGPNLLQAMGQFNGHYILVVSAMSIVQTSDLPPPQDYVQPDTILSGTDSEVVEGASRISLNCPISYKRIKIPAKGHLCKHYQCFDFSNYVKINSKRPSWRCPHCNQSVGFADLRVDRMIVKVLQEVGENVSEVTIDADGSWKVAPSNSKDDLHDKTTNKHGEHEADESSGKSDGQCNVFDLTGEDYEMDTDDRHEFVDQKSIVNHNIQSQLVFPNSASPSNPRSANELSQYSYSQALNGLSFGTLPSNPGLTNHNLGFAPVLTDAVSPSLNRYPNNVQGTSYPSSSTRVSQISPISNTQLQDAFNNHLIPRNVSRVPSAIQAPLAQMPTPSSQQHVRRIMSSPSGIESSVPFQMPLASTQHVPSTARQWHLLQSQFNAHHVSSMPTASLQNHAALQGVGMSAPSFNSWMHQPLSQPLHFMRPPQTLSQPRHLMSLSQLRRNHPQQGLPGRVVSNNSPSTVQLAQLTSQQPSPVRQLPTIPSQPHLAQTSSSPLLYRGFMPQAVSNTENLFDLQHAEQTWRPTGQMLGSLTGPAYTTALSQHMSPRPPATSASSIPLGNNLELLMAANRMIAHATRMQSRPTSDGGSNVETSGTQGDGS